MHPPLFDFPRRGSALVTVLGLSVIVVVIVVASLSYTANERVASAASSNMALAHMMADGAADLVIGDLVGEMLASGTLTTGSNNVRVIRPASASVMMPVRVLKDASMENSSDFRNLLKQSVSGKGVFPVAAPYDGNGAVHQFIASSSNSSELSLNGRRLSEKRWNAPLLLTGSGFASSSQLPDWVYMTRRGPAGTTGSSVTVNSVAWSDNFANHQSGNKDCVIGRFAYNIYDVGGLLDVNAAGAPTGMTIADLKASLAGSVLTNVPGVSDAGALTGWRNAAAPADAASFTTYATQQAIRLAFLKACDGDRRFNSRWDLIQWAKNYKADTGLALSSLPYLTHYTRTLDAPSFTRNPDFDTISTGSSGTFPGYAARTVSIYNPDVLSTCFSSQVTLSDSNSTTVAAGMPVAFRRFPLRRLALVSGSATAKKDNTDNIYRNFGIYRDSATAPWVYDHGSSNSILALDQVAAAGREPDFFELLQAAIANGSLGASCGNYGDLAQDLLSTDRNFFRHVLQIGVNAIDQYDSDSNPTLLTFYDASGGQINIAGVENLPYINNIGTLVYRRAFPDDRSTVAAWYQVQLWNPHRNASQTPSAELRVILRNGQADLKLFTKTSMRDYKGLNGVGGYSNNGYTMGSAQYSAKQNFSSVPSYLQFDNSAAFASPLVLGPSGVSADGVYGISGASAANNVVIETATKPKTTAASFAGIYVGEISGVPDDFIDDPAFGNSDVTTWGKADHAVYGKTNPIPYVWNNACIRPNPSATSSGAIYFELQIKIDGNWVTYQKLAPLTGCPEVRSSYGNDYAYYKPQAFDGYAAVDPRTQRFSLPIIYSTQFSTGHNAWRFGTGDTDSSAPTNLSAMIGNAMKSNTSSYCQGVGWANSYQQMCSTLAYNLDDSSIDLDGADSYQTYKNADGVKRQADGNESKNIAEGDRVFPLLATRTEDRPPILNRPFKSVGELGYVFRDEPWKTLNFFTSNSGDAALLDVFCLEENEVMPAVKPVRAGVLNLNTASEEVLTAVLEGLLLRDGDTSTALSHELAGQMAASFAAYRANTPLRSKGELPRFLGDSFFTSQKYYRKTQKEAFIRTVADVGDVRAWNLMIDLVAQSGKFASNVRDFSKFSVDGECHYWIFVSLDRFTGQLIDKKIEIPYE